MVVELVLNYATENLKSKNDTELIHRIASYRGGYNIDERRAIESSLFSGHLLGATATCALELGVDIGTLDVTLHLGFPGSFSSLWQQAGRAGRGGRPSLSLMICRDSPVDQFFVKNPSLLFASDACEAAVLNPYNSYILRAHLVCAARELPLNTDFHSLINGDQTDREVCFSDRIIWGGEIYDEIVSYLRFSSMITVPRTSNTTPRDVQVYIAAANNIRPSKDISLRRIDPATIQVDMKPVFLPGNNSFFIRS
jgi:DEAD/DEAH box helicase domain-containing protein